VHDFRNRPRRNDETRLVPIATLDRPEVFVRGAEGSADGTDPAEDNPTALHRGFSQRGFLQKPLKPIP
jgi:hypothetical protein